MFSIIIFIVLVVSLIYFLGSGKDEYLDNPDRWEDRHFLQGDYDPRKKKKKRKSKR